MSCPYLVVSARFVLSSASKKEPIRLLLVDQTVVVSDGCDLDICEDLMKRIGKGRAFGIRPDAQDPVRR